MKILDLANPEMFIYSERYVNQGSRTYSSFAQKNEGLIEYQPTSSCTSFDLPCLIIPAQKTKIHLGYPSLPLLTHYIHHDHVLFPVHPEIIKDNNVPFMETIRNYPVIWLSVSPTASTRTVKTCKQTEQLPFHFIKLHYPRRISRFIRRLRLNTIQHCIEVSKDLADFTFPDYGYFPESLGVTYGPDSESWGYLIREFTPHPQATQKTFYFPLFALYSQDQRAPLDLPLLIQLIQYHQADPLAFTFDYIMKPIIRTWCSILLERGILFEMHGQNTLLEFDSDLVPTRILYRDLDTYVDPDTRKDKHLSLPFPKSHLIFDNKNQIYSLKYDGFIGHHLFDYLAALLKRYYLIDERIIQKSCQKAFGEYFPIGNPYFSDKTFYYSDELLADNQYKIIQTNLPPKWR